MDAMRKHSAPDLRAFNILIKGYSRAGDLAALQRTLQSIQNQVLTRHRLLSSSTSGPLLNDRLYTSSTPAAQMNR